jgi:hypothetical protein
MDYWKKERKEETIKQRKDERKCQMCSVHMYDEFLTYDFEHKYECMGYLLYNMFI